MAAAPLNVSSLFSAVLDALKSASPTPAQSDAVVFQSLMMIAGDNWSPFDRIREPLRAYVSGVVQSVGREAYAATLAQILARTLGEDADLSLELVSACREDADPLGFAETVSRTHFLAVIDGILDYEPTPDTPFSAALQSALVTYAGELFEGLAAMMSNGPSGLTAIFQRFAKLASTSIAQASPQHAPMAMMAEPIVVGLLQRMHSQYKVMMGM